MRNRTTVALFFLIVGIAAQQAAAYYHTPTGRWISRDPYGYRAGSANLYSLTSSAPTKYTDPYGLYRIGTPSIGNYGGASISGGTSTGRLLVDGALGSACERFSDLSDLLRSCGDAVADEYERAPINGPVLGNTQGQSWLQSKLDCANEACSKPIKVNILCDCEQGTDAYVNYYFGYPWPELLGGPTINICPGFFDDALTPTFQGERYDEYTQGRRDLLHNKQKKIASHEVGRICGLGESNTGTNNDVGKYDTAIDSLERQADRIRAKCGTQGN